MDKNTITGMLLMAVVIFGFMWLNQPSEEEIAKAQQEQMEQQAVEMANKAAAEQREAKRQAANDSLALDSARLAEKHGAFAACTQGANSTVTIKNDVLSLDIATKGGAVSKVSLLDYTAFNDSASLTLFSEKTNQFGFYINSNARRYNTADYYFTPESVSDSTVTMALDLGNGSKWGIRYTLHKGSYMMRMEVLQQNMSAIIPSNIANIDLYWNQRLSRHEEGKMFEERNSAVYFKYLGDNVEQLSESSDDSKTPDNKVKWVSFTNQFFSSALIPDTYFTNTELESKVMEKGTVDYQTFLKDMSMSASMEYSSENNTPLAFNVFYGPNKYHLLKEYSETYATDSNDQLALDEMISLGWRFFRWINKWIIIPLFDWINSWGIGMGWAILVFTIIIKTVLFPLTYKSYISQAKMRILAPDIKELNEKYPGQENAMKRQQKSMELYSRAGASPMSGCLPMLLSMPILISVFTFFPSCIDLRGEAFLWAKDLSAPDAICSWTAQIPFITNYFGNHISLFCLLMTVTNIGYTYVNMQSQSNQMPGMKWMMYLMPIMFLVFFNNYASGLSYYYFVSLLFTILQTVGCRYLVKEDAVRRKMAEAAAKPQKKSGWMARIEEMQRQQQAMMREQEKRKNNNGKGRR